MTLHLNIIGGLLVVLALVHSIFPKYFKWKEDLKDISLINRQLIGVHTFFIALFLFLLGLLCLTSAEDLVSTPLGRRICLGIAVFWTIRLVVQYVGYSWELWKGKVFETVVHIGFTLLWIYLSGVFWAVYLGWE